MTRLMVLLASLGVLLGIGSAAAADDLTEDTCTALVQGLWINHSWYMSLNVTPEGHNLATFMTFRRDSRNVRGSWEARPNSDMSACVVNVVVQAPEADFRKRDHDAVRTMTLYHNPSDDTRDTLRGPGDEFHRGK